MERRPYTPKSDTNPEPTRELEFKMEASSATSTSSSATSSAIVAFRRDLGMLQQQLQQLELPENTREQVEGLLRQVRARMPPIYLHHT